MRNSMRWLGCLLLVGAVGGCATPRRLAAPPGRAVTVPPQIGVTNLPVEVRVEAPERLPVVGKSHVTYPLRPLVQQAFQNGVEANFRAPQPGEAPAYRIEVRVLRSHLEEKKGARYSIQTQTTLFDAHGQRVFSRSYTANMRSRHDKQTVPHAVWSGVEYVTRQFFTHLAQDATLVAAMRGAERAMVRQVYECDLQVLDLSGRRVTGVTGRVQSQLELRALAETLVRELDQQWTRRGIPRVAVLDFRATGATGAANMGEMFAGFVETAVEAQRLGQIVDRRRMDIIMQEHDLRASDIMVDPGQLSHMPIAIDAVDFFITGQISVVGSK